MTTVEVLRKAQAVLLGRGLAKHTLEDSDGKVCAVGAMQVVLFGSARPGTSDAQRERTSDLCRLIADANSLKADRSSVYVTPLVQFNNADETTLGDVLQAFDAAIAYAEAGATPGGVTPGGGEG